MNEDTKFWMDVADQQEKQLAEIGMVLAEILTIASSLGETNIISLANMGLRIIGTDDPPCQTC